MMTSVMARRGAWTAALAGLLLTAGCYEHTVAVGGGAPHAPVVDEHWQNFWLGGLVGHVRVDVEEVCPSGKATIEAKQTFLNGLVAALTTGIYTPTTLKIRCQDGRRSAVDLTSEDVETIVGDEAFLVWVGQDLPEQADEVARAQTARAQQP